MYKIVYKNIKSGEQIPAIEIDGELNYLHSTYNPINEAKKIVDQFTCELLFVIGTGDGNYLKENFKNKIIFIKFQIEKEIIFFDENTIFFDENFKKNLLKKIGIWRYKNYNFYFNPTIKKLFPTECKNCKIGIEKILNTIFDNIGIFKKFAKQWTLNFNKNIKIVDQNSVVKFKKVDKAYIIGAGPSLDEDITKLKNISKDSIIISSDTAYRALIKNGIAPDYVINIDANPISFHHFFGLDNSKTKLVLEILSSPILTKFFDQFFYISSYHPLSILTHKFLNLPLINLDSGNVLITAYNFSKFFTPNETIFFGADFAYIDGKSYARETYLPVRWNSISNRLLNIETYNFMLIHRTEVKKFKQNGKTIYTTNLLEKYKNSLLLEKNNSKKNKYDKNFDISNKDKIYKAIENLNCESPEILPLFYFYFFKNFNFQKSMDQAVEIIKRTSSARIFESMDSLDI